MASQEEALLCPSAQPDQSEAVAFGVVEGTAEKPRVSYLRRPIPVVLDLLALSAPVEPTEVFRFAAACVEDACQHFAEGSCNLAAKIGRLVEGSDLGVKRCAIRPRCRWWRQEGPEACRRCQFVVTRAFAPSPDLYAAAQPPSGPQD